MDGASIANSFNNTSYHTNQFVTGAPRPKVDRDRGRLLLTSAQAKVAQAAPALTSVLGGEWLTHLSTSNPPDSSSILTGVLIGGGWSTVEADWLPPCTLYLSRGTHDGAP